MWSEEAPQLTLVAFALLPDGDQGRAGIAVFAVDSSDATLISARLAELGDDGTVAAVHTLTSEAAPRR